MSSCRIDIYRHAESASNAGEKTAWPDTIPLTIHGRRQAEDLARSIAVYPTRLVSSPFLRSSETLMPIARRFPDAGRETWEVQEFTYLQPEACVGTSWKERKPRIDAYWRELDPDFVDGPGAESFRQLLKRASDFLDRLTKLSDGPTLVVSHGQFIQATLLLAENADIDAGVAMRLFIERQHLSPFENCERLQLSFDAGRLSPARG